MTGLEQLNEEERDMSLESLTEEEARDGINFSPDLGIWEGIKKWIQRMEDVRNLLKNVDINEIKEKILEINLEDPRIQKILQEHWFTKSEISEAWEYLEKLKVNPDILEEDLKKESISVTAILIIVAVALTLIDVGIITWRCQSRETYNDLREDKEILKKEKKAKEEEQAAKKKAKEEKQAARKKAKEEKQAAKKKEKEEKQAAKKKEKKEKK